MICSPKLLILTAFFIAIAAAAPSLTDESANTDARLKLPVIEDEVVIVQRRAPNSNSRWNPVSCPSNKMNDSLPAANIVGFSRLWKDVDPLDGIFHTTHWHCEKSGAFVVGGMMFNQADKKLYVPECGFYYVSSQVYFKQFSEGRKSGYAQHQLKVETNCTQRPHSILTNAYTITNTTEFGATTFTGRLFKICAGGSISVKIPARKELGCCAQGRQDATFFSAYLVRSFDCDN